MTKSTKDLEGEASAMVMQDNERGMHSVYVIMTAVADEKGLVGGFRERMFSKLTAAMLKGEITVYSRAMRVAEDAPLKALSMDLIADMNEVRNWLARHSQGALGKPSSAVPRTTQRAIASTPAPLRQARSSAHNESPTKTATDARWAHLPEYKAKALEAAKSKSFTSRTAAAKYAAEQLDPKPRSKSASTGASDEYYPWTTVNEWLKEMGWASVASNE